ncbi:MAG: prolipoprotein diacylglyceryl transferase, partial [Ruminococcaceae bacterium]|nr:prolipoprotein diacylglyceryl transferase [Oscillospiraceae bacterium]
GGLIGGAACFLAIYFGIGALMFKDKIHVRSFFDVCNIAAAAIASAHGFGRIGCLMAGCCHGAPTDAWYGVYFVSYGIKAVPVQLFEAIFLFGLFGFFCYRLIKNKSLNLPLYMILYGVWRFFIEFLRADDRGMTVVSFLSPSQFIAILMIIGSVGLFFGERYIERKLKPAAFENNKENTDANEDINEDRGDED